METENKNMLLKPSILMLRIAAALFVVSSLFKWVSVWGEHKDKIVLGGFNTQLKIDGRNQDIFPFFEIFLIFWGAVLFFLSNSKKKGADIFVVASSIIGLLAMGAAGIITQAANIDDDVRTKLHFGFFVAAIALFLSIFAFVKRRAS